MHFSPRSNVESLTPEERLERLGLALPAVPQPIGTFVNAVRVGNLLFLSGQGPLREDGTLMTGKVGRMISTEEAYCHARLVGLNLLAVTKKETGDLSHVRRIVKLLGMVNADPDFTDHPKVINGCSDLFGEVFGENGFHARSAVGMGSLPNNITVEIEAIVELTPS